MNALVPGTIEHATAIWTLLTDADRAELGAVALQQAARVSARMWCGEADGVPLFLAGVYEHGQAWMIGTPGIARHRKFYLRATRQMADEMQALFPVLRVMVGEHVPRSIRWLRWLGFDVGPPRPLGAWMVCDAVRRAA